MELLLQELEAAINQFDLARDERQTIARIVERLREQAQFPEHS